MPGTITSDLTIVNATGGDAESLTNWTTTAAWSGNPAVSNDVYLQGSNAINARASSATPGTVAIYWNHLTTGTSNLDLVTTKQHVYFWIKCFSLPAMENRVRGGIGVSMSSTAGVVKVGTDPWCGITDSKTWFLTGADFEPLSGWVCYVIDPNSVADFSTGTPVMTSIDRIGIRAAALQTVGAGSIKPLPVIWDAMRYGTSVTLVSGTAASPVTFQDIYATDSLTANQWGILTKNAGIYFIAGKIKFGTFNQTVASTFIDINQVVIFQDMPVASTFYELVLTGSAAKPSSVTFGSLTGSLTSNGCIFKGSGLNTRRFIAPVTGSSGGTGYTANDILTVVGGTGTPATFKVITVSGGVINDVKMETAGVYLTPPTGSLTTTGGTGTGANFTATVAGGSIWTLNASGSNQTLKLYGCTLSEMLTAQLSSGSVIDGCTISNSGEIVARGATIKNCNFLDLRSTAPINASYQLTITGSSPVLTNNKYTNCATAIYWNHSGSTNSVLDDSVFTSAGAGHAIEFGPTTPGSPATLTFSGITFSGYAGTAGTNLVSDSGSTSGSVFNNSGKALIINVTNGTTPIVRNGPGATTTVNSNISITLTGLKNPTEVRVFTAGTTTEIAGQETISGGTFAFSVGSGVAVDISILSLGYQNQRVLNYSSLVDVSIPIVQIVDRQYLNP